MFLGNDSTKLASFFRCVVLHKREKKTGMEEEAKKGGGTRQKSKCKVLYILLKQLDSLCPHAVARLSRNRNTVLFTHIASFDSTTTNQR